MITILITGVGDTVGSALVKAARMSSIPCRVIGTDRDPLSAGLHWADAGFVLPHCRERDAYLSELRTICAREKVDLVFPGSESELEILARSEVGATVVASAPEVLSIALNKWETCRFLEREGLNFPAYARLDAPEEVERLIEKCGFPLIAKPFHGTGARGLSVVESREDLRRMLTTEAGMVLQEQLLPAEEEYSVEVYTAKDGGQVGSICYRRRHMVAGDTYKAKVLRNDAAEEEARAVAAALKSAGPCNVQLRMTSRGPVTFEINPRFSGGVSIRAHFGFNEVEMAIRDLVLDQPVPQPVVRGGTALRFWDELYLEDDETDPAAAKGGEQAA